MKRLLLGLSMCFVMLVPLAAKSPRQSFPNLVPGRIQSGRINVNQGQVAYQTFLVQVPETAYAMELQIEGSPTDLDIFIRHEHEITDYRQVDFASAASDYNERMYVTRLGGNGLQTGTYYVDIVYQLGDLPIVDGRRLSQIPYQLRLSFINARVDRVVEDGDVVEGQLDPDAGMFRTYEIRVPASADALRIDLFDADYDIDIFVTRDSPLLDPRVALYKGESLFARENMVITRDSGIPLRTGVYYVSVVDQLSQAMPEDFSLVMSFSEEAPAFLHELPALDVGISSAGNAVQNALNATVQVVSERGTGSGTLLSSQGLVLTNYHVILSADGTTLEKVGIALNLQNDRPPRELFMADVLFCDEQKDLALLKIRHGYYGQVLPPNYRFPWIHLGDSEQMNIADTLIIIGYPGVGGTGSRVSITYSEGVVSGFERTPLGIIFKTDAEMNHGNSGGAALNRNFEMVGVPSSIVNQEAGQIGYVHPVSFLPDEWIEIIRREQE